MAAIGGPGVPTSSAAPSWGRGPSDVPGEHNCVFLKSLIPFVEQEVGPAGVAAIVLSPAGRANG